MPAVSIPPGPALPVVTRRQAAVALALLLGLQPVTTDVYLPALPMIRQDLGASMASVQLTMSLVILAFGLAQMVWGPLADRYGRRPVLLWGLGVYTVASVGAMLAGGIDSLIVWRTLQGVGLAAAVVCARAIVRDLYEPTAGAQVMALALSGLGLLALSGPLLGGLTAAWWGWRAPLALVAATGLATLVFVAARWPETLPEGQPQPLRWRPLLRIWAEVARNRVFRAWALLVACTYGGLFTLLAASSFVYMNVLGLSAAAYGGAMALGSLSYLAGTLLCRRWIDRHGLPGAVARGGGITLLGGGLMAGAAAWSEPTLLWVLLPQCLYAFGHGIHQPCGQAGVVAPFPRAAGAASALAGLLLALVAYAIGRWLGITLNDNLRPMAYGIGFWSLLTALCAWVLVPKART